MLFTEPAFLFLFLPLLLAVYVATPRRLRNLVLLGASLYFYAAGEPRYVVVMLGSILLNYAAGLAIGAVRRERARSVVLAAGVTANLLLLGAFKYAGFAVANLNVLLDAVGAARLPVPDVALPIGISFFTFQAMSYIVDVYRRETPPQRNLLRLALYVALFPQLIAGPILRYAAVASQLVHRRITARGFAEGIRRFIVGLGKKMILANGVAGTVDTIFATPAAQLAPAVAWLGIVCYALQIYFDFSGYSDMAIGLGRMFGFTFPENFRHPYVARSIGEFWRRWHITLSSWFRDYLYIPLGGNRVSRPRVFANLLLVFLLCGLWHGASWAFVVWGLFHGAFLGLERFGLAAWLQQAGRPVQHAYVLLVVLVAWVFFRAEDLGYAVAYLSAMLGAAGEGPALGVTALVDRRLLLVMAAGVVGSAPVLPWAVHAWTRRVEAASAHGALWPAVAGRATGALLLGVVLLMSVMLSAAGTYSPFIYFRF